MSGQEQGAENDGYDRVTVSMPRRTLEDLRAAVAAGAAPSLSALVSQAVDSRLARDRDVARIKALIGPEGLPEEAMAWARRALGVDQPETGAGRMAS